jgi:Zn finger protein HypA/HybF involved in hydrogenase expression
MKTKTSGKNYQGLLEFNSKRKIPMSDILVENSSYARHNLKRRLLQENLLEYRCSCCSNTGEYNSSPLVLQLDHINGVNDDHRLENLRFLCPNCHSQQDTYAAKNRFNLKRKPKKYV